MILPIEGLGEIHHDCQDGGLVRAVLAGKDEINKLNYIVGYRVALEPAVL